MKYLYIFTLVLGLLLSAWVSSAQVMQDPPLTNCLSKYTTNSPHYDFWNVYHSGALESIIQNKIIESYKEICWFYVAGWREEYLTVGKIFPVYSPIKEAPIGLYVVYTGQDYTVYKYDDPSAFYTGAFFAWVFSRLSSAWSYPRQFNGWWLFAWNERLPHNEAYLASTQEPFVSAPMLQMYYYMGKPLLVARSSTGIVTNVFFQGRSNIVDQMIRAKKYLGDKWYYPE